MNESGKDLDSWNWIRILGWENESHGASGAHDAGGSLLRVLTIISFYYSEFLTSNIMQIIILVFQGFSERDMSDTAG